jgi:uncharacterized membrane protein
MDFRTAVEWAGKVLDGAGVAIVVIGVVLATIRFMFTWRIPATPPAYTAFRRSIGRAILLGLEFLVAGDIIRTVATDPTFRSVGVLAIIVGIRTFLSLELELEIEGRWPWQQPAQRENP